LLNANQLKQLAERYPGYEFKIKSGASPHTHPLLSIERMLSEENAYYRIHKLALPHEPDRTPDPSTEFIVDIGGSHLRHKSRKRHNIWCCNPDLDAKDYVRHAPIRGTPGHHCSHRAEVCQCVTPSAYLSVHSIYYLSMDDVCALVNRSTRGILVAVLHRFNAVRGKLCFQEATFEHNEQNVCMLVAGANTPYVHPNPEWIFTRDYHRCESPAWFSRTGMPIAMAWDTCCKFGDSYIVKFSKAEYRMDVPLHPKTMVRWEDALRETSHVLPIDVRGSMNKNPLFATVFEELHVDSSRVFSIFEHVLFYTSTRKKLAVPKGAVAEVQLQMMGKSRDPTTLKNARTHALQALSKYQLEADEMADLAPFVANLGFTRGLQAEYELNTSLVTKYGALMSAYNESLNLQHQPTSLRTMILRAVAVTAAGFIFYKAIRFSTTQAISLGHGVQAGTHSIFKGVIEQADKAAMMPERISFGLVALFGTASSYLQVCASSIKGQLPFLIAATPSTAEIAPVAKAVVGVIEPVLIPNSATMSVASALSNLFNWLWRSIGNFGPVRRVSQVLVDNLPSIEVVPFWIHPHELYRKFVATRTITRTNSYATEHAHNFIISHHPIRRPDICNAAQELVEPHPSAEIKLPLDMTCQEKHGTTQFGPGVAIRVPLMARSCVHNELVAVNNRGCINRTTPYAPIWDFVRWRLSILIPKIPNLVHDGLVLTDRHGYLKPIAFEKWVARFPTGRREELIRAFQKVRDGHKVMITNESFIKREHALKGFPSGNELYDPRLIQGRHPTYTATTGPFCYTFHKMLAALWNDEVLFGVVNFVDQPDQSLFPQYPGEVRLDPLGLDPRPFTKIVFTSGYTAEKLGALVEKAYTVVSQHTKLVVIMEGDASRFDARVGVEAVKCKLDVYTDFGVTGDTKKALSKHTITVGVTKNGIMYRVDATVKSGDNDTSCGNSMLNGGTHEGLMYLAEVEVYIMFVVGDDNLTMMRHEDWERVMNEAKTYWSLVGFKVVTKFMTCLYDAEYCSGRFYPTNHGFVYGPKIGRVMCKTFHAKLDHSNHNGMRWARTVALGMYRDVAFIPVLRVVFQRVLDLTQEYVPLPLKQEERIHATQLHSTCDETYQMLEHLYGLDKRDFDVLEEFISTHMTSIPCTINHEFLNRIVELDVPRDDVVLKSYLYPRGSVFEHIVTRVPKLFQGLYLMGIQAPIMMTLGAILQASYLLFMQVPISDVFHALIGPSLEEYAKATWRYATLAILLVETNARLMDLASMPEGTARNITTGVYIGATLMHILTHAMGRRLIPGGLKGAIIVHTAWNVLFTPSLVGTLDLTAQAVGRAFVYNFGWGWSLVKEAITGDNGYGAALGSAWNAIMHALNGNNPISSLYDMLQRRVIFNLDFQFSRNGDDHNPLYHCLCTCEYMGRKLLEQNTARTKMDSKVNAARLMLAKLKDQIQHPPMLDTRVNSAYQLHHVLPNTLPIPCAPPTLSEHPYGWRTIPPEDDREDEARTLPSSPISMIPDPRSRYTGLENNLIDLDFNDLPKVPREPSPPHPSVVEKLPPQKAEHYPMPRGEQHKGIVHEDRDRTIPKDVDVARILDSTKDFDQAAKLNVLDGTITELGTWDCVYVDADQIHPGSLQAYPIHTRRLLIIGTNAQVSKWNQSAVQRAFKASHALVVPIETKADSADKYILNRVRAEKKKRSLVLTGDLKLSYEAMNLGAIVTNSNVGVQFCVDLVVETCGKLFGALVLDALGHRDHVIRQL